MLTAFSNSNYLLQTLKLHMVLFKLEMTQENIFFGKGTWQFFISFKAMSMNSVNSIVKCHIFSKNY